MTLRVAILLAASLGHAGRSAEHPTGNRSSTAVQIEPEREEATMQIRITAGDQHFTARLEDCAAAREFEAMLPLRLTLKDYASTEKIADLPRKLSTDWVPAGIDPGAGDVTGTAGQSRDLLPRGQLLARPRPARAVRVRR